MKPQGMSHAKHECLRIGLLVGALCLFVDCGSVSASQKIIYSDPATPVEISSTAKAHRTEMLNSGADVSPFSKAAPTYNNTRMTSIPDVILKKEKKKDLFSNDDSEESDTERQKQMLNGSRNSRMERGWETDRTLDPAAREYDKKRAQSVANSRADDYGSERGPWDDRGDSNGRKTKSLSDFYGEGVRENPLERLQESQYARMEEYKKLYEMPSAVAPVSSPTEATISPLNSPWGQQQPTKDSLRDLPSASPRQEAFSRGLPLPTRGFSDSPENRYYNGYRPEARDPNQPDPSRQQPGVLPFPKRPGSLMR